MWAEDTFRRDKGKEDFILPGNGVLESLAAGTVDAVNEVNSLKVRFPSPEGISK